MHVVTLGPAGTYSHRAAQSIADEGAVSFRESVTEIVAAVADGEFDRGVVPIENSIEGSVDESLDALADREVSVVQEIVSPIRHALLAQGPEFDTVASHPQALAQCREYLTENYPAVAQEAVASTARGVERARKDPSVAAIGHPANAGSSEGGDDTHSLQRIAENIQDRDSNATRFLVVAPESERSEAGGKTSLVVYPGANYPGLLLELLEPFHSAGTQSETAAAGSELARHAFSEPGTGPGNKHHGCHQDASSASGSWSWRTSRPDDLRSALA